MQDLSNFQSRAVRALVLLHERELRAFLPAWKRAFDAGVVLPATDDPNYASAEALLVHVLRAARGYATWIAEKTGLPDPEIRATPAAASIAGDAADYLEHVLARWRVALAPLTPEQLEDAAYQSRWNAPYTIDAMLEHAVMHPVRHAFQLDELVAQSAAGA